MGGRFPPFFILGATMETKFKRKAICNSTGERIRDAEYFRGKAYMRTWAQRKRDALSDKRLRKELEDFKRTMNAWEIGYSKG